jgi:predicted nucleic acid-binding protein
VAIVVDANIVVVLTSGDPRQSVAQQHLQQWIEVGEELHAPVLLQYEVANAYTRLVAAGDFPQERVKNAWQDVLTFRIRYHSLHADGARVIAIAQQLRRQSAYDAAYLAIAERLNAELWTFDGPLFRNAVSLGFPVHLMQ